MYEYTVYSGHKSTGNITLSSRRPSGNCSVMESMFKKYKLSDDKWSPDDLDKDIEYAILYDVFGLHWGAGFTQDVEEMLEICKRMVVALEKELQDRNNEHMETLMRAIYCVQKQMYDTGKIGKEADND